MSRFFETLRTANQDTRHGLFMWAMSWSCLTGIMVIVLAGAGAVAQHAIDALASILQVVIPTYLGTDTIHRSEILSGLASRLKGGGEPPATPASPDKGV